MAVRFPWGRAAAAGVAVLFLVLACVFYLRYAVDRAAAQYWTRSGDLAAWKADLSTPGTYSVSFQIEPNMQDPILELEIPRAFAVHRSPKELLAGLHATCRFVASAGKTVFSGGLPYFPLDEQPGRESIRLAEFGYNLAGLCQVTFTVDQGAPALKNVPHRLVVLGHMASFSARTEAEMSVWMGHAALVIAAVILVVVALCSRHQRARPVSHP